MPSAALDVVAPAFQWMPEFHDTLGPEVADLCAAVGFVPDPEQRLALDWTFAFDRSGKSATHDFGLVAPRQNLKTGFLKMCALGWLYVLETRLIVWSAHEFRTSQEAFRDMCILIENTPDLDREVLRTSRGKTGISRGNGDEAIELRGDRRLIFKARTDSGGRGLTGDRVVLDEAMYLKPNMMAALTPTLRAVKDPQLIFAGSAGLVESSEWRRVRDAGRAGNDPSLAYLEWADPSPWDCADEDCRHDVGQPGCSLDDEDRWWSCNTALHSGRISIDSLRSDRRRLTPIKFATETLGWWEDPPPDDTQVDDILANWATVADEDASPTGRICLGLAVSHDLKAASITAYGAYLDGGAPEVIEWRKQGTGWIGARLLELTGSHDVAQVGVVAGSPAWSLVSKRDDGTHWIGDTEVQVLPGTDFAGACAALVQDVNDGRLKHRTQQPMEIAVTNAVRKFAGDGWRWSLKDSPVDIGPLHGAVIARHLAGLARPDYEIEDSAW